MVAGMKEDKPKDGGTGVWLPPSVTSRIQRTAAANSADVPSPAHTPVSSRSSSFSSSTSSGPCAPGLGRPPHHSAGTCPAPRAVASTPQLGQHVSTVRRPQCSAGDAQMRPATQGGYGRFSLDHASAAPAQHMQSCTGAAWPAGTVLCNSLSVPAPLNAVSSAMMHQAPAGIVLQDDMSWASTVSGDVVLLPAGADAAVLATAQQLQMAQQREHDCQLMQAQHEQQLLLAQQERDRQLLLSQLGSMAPAPCAQPYAGSTISQDSALLAQLQCNRPAAERRASVSCYMQLPAADMCLDARACSVPLGGAQMPQFATATSPLPGVGAAADLADAADNALEAELDAALQQLLAMRNEVELKKERAKQARASMDSCRSITPIPMQQAPQTPAVSNSMCSTAVVLSSQLYQPFAALNCAPRSASFSVPQMAVAQAPAPAACAPSASQHTSFIGFAPVTGFTSVPDSFGLPARSLQATAASVLGLNAGIPLHASLDGQPLRTEGTLADWLACNPGAGLSAQQAAVQANLQLLGLR